MGGVGIDRDILFGITKLSLCSLGILLYRIMVAMLPWDFFK